MTDTITYLDWLTGHIGVEELWSLHVDQMAQYGFDRLIYGYTRYRSGASLGDPQDWVLLTNHDESYMSAYIDEGLFFNAPMTRWAQGNEGARSWAWIGEAYRNGEFGPAELKIVEFNRRHKVTAGYTIAFPSNSERTKGAVALTARPGMGQDEVDAIWAEHGQAISVMNNVMHLKLLTLPWSGQRSLTKRQVEVLQWVGDGKTTQDVALLLGLTAATVEKHLRLAREALDVETTAQAVLKAAFYNQMFVVET